MAHLHLQKSTASNKINTRFDIRKNISKLAAKPGQQHIPKASKCEAEQERTEERE